jgi:hypothetical protein
MSQHRYFWPLEFWRTCISKTQTNFRRERGRGESPASRQFLQSTFSNWTLTRADAGPDQLPRELVDRPLEISQEAFR